MDDGGMVVLCVRQAFVFMKREMHDLLRIASLKVGILLKSV